jgi:hypothetical protein
MSAERRPTYFVFYDHAADEDAVIEELPAGVEGYELFRGVALGARFPKHATLRFSKAYAGRKLRDFQPTTCSLPIASPKARAVLEALGLLPELELLPVDILDHRGRVAGADYSIVHVLAAHDAIDMKRSEVRMNPVVPTKIQRVRRLVLDRDAIPPTAALFRCTTMPRTYLIRDDVARAFEAAGLTGYKAVEAEAWNGLPI